MGGPLRRLRGHARGRRGRLRRLRGAEPRYLLAAESIVSDWDVDLTDEFRDTRLREVPPRVAEAGGPGRARRRLEPQGVGFAALISPAYAIGGATGVAIFLAAVAALAFVLAARLARRIVPEPWATRRRWWSASPRRCWRTPPPSTRSSRPARCWPARCCARCGEGAARPGSAVVGATLLALLPWLGPKYLLPAAPVAVALVRWTARRGRRTAALAAAEIIVASLVVYATINDRLYSGLVPSSVAASGEPPTGADSLSDYAGRAPRLAALWLDHDVGLVRWAPVLLLVLFSVWLLWRARSQHLARVVAEHADAEAAAGLSLLVCGRCCWWRRSSRRR